MRPNKQLLVLASTLLAGCATSDNPLEQEVTINSKPKGAMVELNGERIGRTPVRTTLDRTKNHELTLDKAGHDTRVTVIRPTLRADNTYGFAERINVELDSESSTAGVDAATREALNKAREAANAPEGVDPEIYGTYAGDLAEAKASAGKLATLANVAKEDAAKARAALAAALAAAQQGEGQAAADAEAKLNQAEASLKKAVADAETSEANAKIQQEVVRRRLEQLEAAKAEPAPVQAKASAEVDAAKASAEAAAKAAGEARASLAAATAALEAAAKARAEATGGANPEKLQAALADADNRKVSGEELAQKLAQSSAAIAARVDELASVAAAKNAANAAADAESSAAKRLEEANARAAALEQRIREHAYGEYTARKGLLERRLRMGELNRETYRELLAELDKEIRGR